MMFQNIEGPILGWGLMALLLVALSGTASGFSSRTIPSSTPRRPVQIQMQKDNKFIGTRRQNYCYSNTGSRLYAISADDEKKIKASAFEEKQIITTEGRDGTNKDEEEKAAEGEEKALTGTINDRLLAELQEAADKEKYGAKSSFGKKYGLSGFRPRKSDEEIRASIEEARNLNGVNPVVALLGGVFAIAVAAGMWYGTNLLGAFFAMHPVETDVYFVQRLAAVFRNVVMGMASLASGFFGVTGLGIFLLGVRVAIGVAKGELDPTPIKKNNSEKLKMPNVWNLMMNKKPGRRGGGGDDNPFGI